MARTKHPVKCHEVAPNLLVSEFGNIGNNINCIWLKWKKRSVEAGPSATPSTPTRKTTRTAPATSVQKSKQEKRYRPGTVALREIRHFQKTWNLVIPAAPFIRHVREVSHFFAPEVTRWQAEALIAIQEVRKAMLLGLFKNDATSVSNSSKMY
ncbi:hypothetical protein KY290_007702 [Solanum tuberosum]|uniref:Core Histone H2A/H2B/H3 domain-containing protein n=1 Tax=Solanum tuberosum TaxID=4113 RepID=A0ABQ7W6B3_SOLTU|nr:hypothetical protein KY290_007702 [Solanum tuberosum]